MGIKEKYTMQQRYNACLKMAAIGDTIGYFNGDWEFNYGDIKEKKGIPDALFAQESSQDIFKIIFHVITMRTKMNFN